MPSNPDGSLKYISSNVIKMNIYDTRIISCKDCGKAIGEIDFDAKVILPQCGQCADPLPGGDKILYTISHFQNSPQKKVVIPLSK